VESFHGRPVRVYGIVQDITERRRLEAELLEAANREQQKLGSDLHDGLGQELTGISLLLQGLGQQVKAANPSLAEPLERISSLLSAAIRSTRSLAHGLAPVSLGRGGLEGALRILAEQASASYSVSVNLEIGGEAALNLGEVAGNHVYRIVQEALSNAVRHGRARHITIQLAPTRLNFVLDVTDNGCGIEEWAIQSGGFGLRSMKYRAQALGGTLSVGKAPGGGTLVRLTCPHPDV
jgi:signal transduction histidine kinase